MSRDVLVVQSDDKSAQPLIQFFTDRGDRVCQAFNPSQALTLLQESHPEVVLLDLHLPNDGFRKVLRQVKKHFPLARILYTTRYPDPDAEAKAKALGARSLLRQPFTSKGIEQAMASLEGERAKPPRNRIFRVAFPHTRIPVRVKIALPFAMLALVFAIASAYVVSQVVVDSMDERFTNQLIESGKVTADWMVQEENRLLGTLRLLAFTQGLPEALANGDSERLREIALPVAVNYQEEDVELLDSSGVSILSLRHHIGGTVEDYDFARGEGIFQQWAFVRSALEGRVDQGRDKFAGLGRAPWGDYFYIAGPVFDASGKQVGVVLVGKSLATLVQQLRQTTMAHTTIYDPSGAVLASTLLTAPGMQPLPAQLAAQVSAPGSGASVLRELNVASVRYKEIVGPFETRDGSTLGYLGTSLAGEYYIRTSQVTRFQILILVAAAILLVVSGGVFLADRITHPLLKVVDASAQVAQGNLEVEVEPVGDDEVADLANSFNYMVSGLREGYIYRDLLGRTVSPEVREQLREAIASGSLRLEGEDAMATVLIADIRGFTALSEKAEPTTILNWLNEYFGELVPVVAAHSGVVNKFDGDALLAFFGILPARLTAEESAHRGCLCAIDMLKTIDELNSRRQRRGEPPFLTGIGINTGPVTAGGLGTVDRISYTIIGDTVNTTQRVSDLTRDFGESGAVLTERTWTALEERRSQFRLEPLGAQALKGKIESLRVYRLWPIEMAVSVR